MFEPFRPELDRLVLRLRTAPLVAALLVLATAVAHAAPYIPDSDAVVVERLPGRASDPAIKRVESLRKQLAARPDDGALRV